MNFYNPSPAQEKIDQDREDDRIRKIASEAIKPTVKDWLVKPVIVEVCKYSIIVAIAFIGGVYSSDIKNMLYSNPENIKQQKPTEQIKKP
jgi:hypothetical protein